MLVKANAAVGDTWTFISDNPVFGDIIATYFHDAVPVSIPAGSFLTHSYDYEYGGGLHFRSIALAPSVGIVVTGGELAWFRLLRAYVDGECIPDPDSCVVGVAEEASWASVKAYFRP